MNFLDYIELGIYKTTDRKNGLFQFSPSEL